MILHPSPNHGPRPEGTPIDMLVLHYTGMADGPSALARLCDPIAEVSAHYLIEEDGTTFALVDEERRAWHAGVAYWRGHRDVNSRSIGIELVNPGHEFGYRPFPPAQMEALAALATGILARHPIPPRNVVGHSDVAPARKRDPGELFDWEWLAERGVGVWAEPETDTAVALDDAALQAMMTAWGYETGDAGDILAFQQHFRPERCDGIADQDLARLLARQLEQINEHPDKAPPRAIRD